MRLAVFGASGHGKVVGDAAALAGWDQLLYFDDRWPELRSAGPWAVTGTFSDLMRRQSDFDAAVVAIGDNRVRLARQHDLTAAGIVMATIVHPATVVSRYAMIGEGSVVFAGAVINPFSIIGAAVIVNTGSTVDHDCMLADGVHVSPGAHLGGGVRVGEASWIGIGASVRHAVTIEADVIVGAGAAVVADVPRGLTVVGVPARVLTHSGE